MSGLKFEYLDPVAYESLSIELTEQEGDLDLFVNRFEELEESLKRYLSKNWKFDYSGKGDFFLDGDLIFGCEISVGLTNERMMTRAFIESIVNFLEEEKSNWIIELKWVSFDGSCEGLAGRAFVHKNKAYFDLSYPKDGYKAFLK